MFLQFIFDLNVVSYIEHRNGKTFIRWCFRERNYSNILPKVKTNVEYQIHYGLLKSLNFGLDFSVKKQRTTRNKNNAGNKHRKKFYPRKKR